MNRRALGLGLLLALLVLACLAALFARAPVRGRTGAASGNASRHAPAEPRGEAAAATPEREAGTRQEQEPYRLASPPAAEPGAEPAPPSALALVVTGSVLGADGRPIEGAEVFMGDPWEGELLLACTDASGAFRGELGVRPDSFLFTAFAPGFEGTRKDVREPRGAELRLGAFWLAPGGEVEGRIVDEGGQALARAWVYWLPSAAFPSDPEAARKDGPEEEDYDDARFHALVLSAADGRFRMRGLPLGECFLAAGADGRSHGWTEIFAVGANPVRELEIVLLPSATALSAVAGIVQGPAGEPLAGIEIQLHDHGQRWDCTSTGADGCFLIDAGWNEPVELGAHDPERRWAPARISGVRPGTRDLVFRLREPEWVVVRLEDSERAPIPWGHVRHEGKVLDAGRSGALRIQRSDEPLQLEGSAPGYRTKTFGPFDPGALGEELRLTLEPGQALRGRVVHRGRPVPGARLDIAVTRPPGEVREARGTAPLDHPFLLKGSVQLGASDGTSDAAGAFVLTIHNDGWHSLRVEAEGFPTTVFGPYALERTAAGGAELELELARAGAIEGRVRTAPGNEARERLVAVSNGWSLAHTAAVEPDGSYRLENLAPGPYQVRPCEPPAASLQALGVAGETNESIAWDCEVRAGETTRFELDLSGEGSVVLAGSLALARAEPREWQAYLFSTGAVGDGSKPARASAAIDERGGFELRLSRPGTYRLELRAPPLRIAQDVELFGGRNEWKHRFETGRVRVRPGATQVPRQGLTLLRYVAMSEGSIEFTALLHANQLRAEGGNDWVFHAPVGPGRLEVKPDASAPHARWTLVRELAVERGQELVLEYP